MAQYPDITPPTVEVSAVYPGANAQVVADTVAAPIEQQVNGVENMLYMSSQCTNDGTYTLTVTFKNGVDLNMAQVLVENRESLADPVLPDLVKRRGVSVKKKSPSVLMIVNLFSPDNSRDNLYLSNYATIQLKDELSRLPGVGDITYIGQRDYSMRLWLDPKKMAYRNLTANDVITTIQQQNTQVAAGQIGQAPVAPGQVFQLTMSTMGRLVDVEQFADMILKTDNNGGLVRVRDVAKIELGALAYDQTCTLDGQSSVALSVYQLPGSNALKVARDVKAKMEDLKARFPQGLDYRIVYDTTPFVSESILEVVLTLIDAVVLVAIVVLLFLQNWRSAIIPLVAVPVAIIGTFAVMVAMGFSLNNLTLFGLVLGDRHRRRRCDRGGGGGRTADGKRPLAAGRHGPRHGIGLRPRRRRGTRAERRFRPLHVHYGHHRPVLQAVCPHDCRLDGHLGLQLADTESGALGPALAAQGP